MPLTSNTIKPSYLRIAGALLLGQSGPGQMVRWCMPPKKKEPRGLASKMRMRTMASCNSWLSLCAFWSGRRDSNPRPRPWQGNNPATAGCRASQWASSVAASASALANSEPSRSSSALVLIAGVHLRGGGRGPRAGSRSDEGRHGKTASARAAEYCARANGLETFMRSLV
jgi:hypothetical protein